MIRILFLTILYFLSANPAFAGYSYIRSITVNASQVSGGAALTQFPILVCGNGASPCNISISGLKTAANGGNIQNTTTVNGQTVPADLIFTTDSGCSTLLNWEIEDYVATTGEFEAWVSNSTTALSATANTTFYMCYGNAAVTTYQSTASAVWDSNYKLVYHFANGTTLSTVDSTGNTANGTLTGPPAAAAGKVDGGAQFDIHATDSVESGLTTGLTTTMTVSFWGNATGDPSALMRAFDQYNSAAVGSGLTWYDEDDFQVPWSGGNASWTIAPGPSNNVWHYTVITYNAGSTANVPLIYIDGVSQTVTVAAAAAGTVTTLAGNWYFGNREDGARVWEGNLDEFRVSLGIIRSAGWIVTEYNNQTSPVNFYTVGPQQSIGPHQNLINGVSKITSVSLIN
jgi:hypothetical protein